MTKTNVMRLLDAAKIPYRAAEYEVDENDLNGMHAAEGIGMPPEQIFKTLVAKGERGGFAVFCTGAVPEQPDPVGGLCQRLHRHLRWRRAGRTDVRGEAWIHGK